MDNDFSVENQLQKTTKLINKLGKVYRAAEIIRKEIGTYNCIISEYGITIMLLKKDKAILKQLEDLPDHYEDVKIVSITVEYKEKNSTVRFTLNQGELYGM